MKARDQNGRYIKKNKEDSQLTLIFPPIKSTLYWILILIIFLPWLIILSKFDLLEKLNALFEGLISGKYSEPTETGKKNGIFY